MNKPIAIAAAVLLMHLSGASCAEPRSGPRFGAFEGTIGKSRIRACFSRHGAAQYYYLRHHAGIRLEIADVEDDALRLDMAKAALENGEIRFFEATSTWANASEASGFWTLRADAAGWSGEWRSPDKSKHLPITLKRLPGSDGELLPDGECPPAHFAPLRDDLQITYADADFEGHAYRTLTTASAMAMDLPGTTPAAKAIHDDAIRWLQDQAMFGYECAIGNGSGNVALDRTLRPVVWSGRFLVQEDNLPDTYCGGAHGNFEQHHVVWDLDTGKPIDTWSWFDHPSIDVTQTEDGEPVRSALRQLLHDHYPRIGPDEECREYLDIMSIAPPYPTAEGLVFPTTFFHAMRACGDPITLTWEQVAPHVSEAGKAVAWKLSN